VHDLRTYDYAIVRVVPRVERGEFVNAGIILSCDVERILQACVELDEAALIALDAAVDLELVRKTLASIPAICAGGAEAGEIGRLVRARALSLVGLAQEHHRADVPGAHRPVQRYWGGARALDEPDGSALTFVPC
jgi:hypothetical protein